MKSADNKELNYQFKTKVNMKTKTSILVVTKAFFILLVSSCFYTIKCKNRHRIGNIIQALVNFIDSFVTIISLGFLYTRLPEKWIIYRIGSKWYQQNNC